MGIIRGIFNFKKQRTISIKKYGEDLEEIGFHNQKHEYDCAIEKLTGLLEDSTYKRIEKISMIESMLLAIKLALQYDHLASAFYTNKDRIGGLRNEIFPEYYLDKNGNKCSLPISKYKKEVHFSKDIILARPWNWKRFIKHKIRKEEFIFDEENH